MQMPLVSVLIITWNRRDDVLVAVGSVYDQAYRNYEVIVVDNGSTDGTADTLKQAYPAVTVVALGRNTGVCEGRNAGIAVARGEIIFLLDSDASLDRETLGKIVVKFAAEPTAGVIACKILNAFTGELDPQTWIYTERDKADQDRAFLSYSFCECAVGVRREVFDRAGLFWDLLFFGREGDDLSLRVWDADYTVLYWPEAIAYHRVSPEKRVTGCQRDYFDLRNSLWIYAVRYPGWMLVLFLPLRAGVGLVKGIRKGCAGDALRALRDAAKPSAALKKQRRPIRSATARRYLRLLREHGPLAWDLASWLRHKA